MSLSNDQRGSVQKLCLFLCELDTYCLKIFICLKSEGAEACKTFTIYLLLSWILSCLHYALSGLPNANAKSQRFSYAISQIATLPPVVALNRNSKSQIAARYAAFWHAIPQIALASFISAPKSQRFKSQRLQDANATKSQTLAFYKSQRFSATKIMLR